MFLTLRKNKLKKEESKETKETQPPNESTISTVKRKRAADSTSSLSDSQLKESIPDKKSTSALLNKFKIEKLNMYFLFFFLLMIQMRNDQILKKLKKQSIQSISILK